MERRGCLTNVQICKSCGQRNFAKARFCQSCGAPLTEKTSGKSVLKPKNSVKKGVDSYLLLGAAFIFSIIVIMLIFNSNRQTLLAKINKTNNQIQSGAANAMQPSLDEMQKIQQQKELWQKNPNDVDLNVQMGNSYFDINQYDKAIQFYRRAVNLKKDQPNVLIDLGVSYFNITRSDSAIVFINQALAIEPNHMQGLYNLGVIYFNLKKNDMARTAWERLIQLYPTSREAQAAKDFINHIKEQKNPS